MTHNKRQTLLCFLVILHQKGKHQKKQPSQEECGVVIFCFGMSYKEDTKATEIIMSITYCFGKADTKRTKTKAPQNNKQSLHQIFLGSVVIFCALPKTTRIYFPQPAHRRMQTQMQSLRVHCDFLSFLNSLY